MWEVDGTGWGVLTAGGNSGDRRVSCLAVSHLSSSMPAQRPDHWPVRALCALATAFPDGGLDDAREATRFEKVFLLQSEGRGEGPDEPAWVIEALYDRRGSVSFVD